MQGLGGAQTGVGFLVERSVSRAAGRWVWEDLGLAPSRWWEGKPGTERLEGRLQNASGEH